MSTLLFMGSGDLNSCPPACNLNTLPTEPSPTTVLSWLLIHGKNPFSADKQDEETNSNRSERSDKAENMRLSEPSPPSSLSGAFYRPKDNRDSFINLERKWDKNNRTVQTQAFF